VVVVASAIVCAKIWASVVRDVRPPSRNIPYNDSVRSLGDVVTFVGGVGGNGGDGDDDDG